METSTVVLLGYAVLGVFGFGLRTGIQWLQTGSSGWRILVGKSARAAVVYELLIAVGLGCLVASPLAVRADLVEPWWESSSLLRIITGIWFAASTTAMLVAQFEMGAAWRIGVDERERTQLITHGLFRFVRNPIFTALLGSIAALVVMQPTVLSVFGLLGLVAALSLHVRHVEEPHLHRQFGAMYQAYAAQAGRFLPRLGRLSTR